MRTTPRTPRARPGGGPRHHAAAPRIRRRGAALVAAAVGALLVVALLSRALRDGPAGDGGRAAGRKELRGGGMGAAAVEGERE